MKELMSSILDRAAKLKTQKVSSALSPEDLKKEFDLALSEHPIASKEAFDQILDGIFKYSVNTQNPRFLNQLYGGTHEITWIGEFIASVLNTSMATYEIAPLATLMEKELISSINKEIGFKKADGLMVPGGSYANMLGIHSARQFKEAEAKDKGLYKKPKLHVYVSKNAHYSSEKAMGLLGLGTENLIKVDVDQDHKMSVSALRAAIEKSISEGAVPICVVSTAGTTVWGSFDPISEIQDLCEEHKLWHHVDAAWGGLGLWSNKKSELFKGVEQVDSITMDFHKLMASSLTKAFFITSKPDVMYEANSGGGAKYIFHKEDESKLLDTGVYAIQCGRKVDSLPLWLQWKLQGTFQYRRKVEELYIMQNWCVDFLKSNEDKYKILHEPSFMNLCFQIKPKDQSLDIGQFNKDLREKLMAEGQFMINFSKSDEHGAFFRLVLNHWGVTVPVLKEAFEHLEHLAFD